MLVDQYLNCFCLSLEVSLSIECSILYHTLAYAAIFLTGYWVSIQCGLLKYIKLLPTLLLLLSSNFERVDGLVMGTTLLQMGLLISE